MSTWKIEHDRTNVVCPDCAFSFDAIHQDETGGYTCPLCEPAPASGEPSGAEAVVREALDAIKKAHAAVDDLCNGRRWTMSIPARPDADHDLVIGAALTKAERVIQSLAGPTAPGALRAAHQERDADARRLARRLANATPPSLDYPNSYTRLAERFHAILTDAAMATDGG